MPAPDFFLDSESPAIEAYIAQQAPAGDLRARLVALFYAIRDGLRYNPYGVSLRPEDYRASVVARRSYAEGGHCIDKAMLLAACARRLGVPARLHFANVRNHIGTEKLEKALGTNLMVFHGYAELWLDGRWVAVTPAFNRQLCERLGVAPLEWDGYSDAIFQQYDQQGGRFMDYVHDYGPFDTLPFDLMLAEWQKYYPAFAAGLNSGG